MLNFTDTARERIATFLEAQRDADVAALRVAGNRSEQRLWLVREEDKQEGDEVQRVDGFEVYLDPMTARALDGASVDFVEGVMQSGFRVFFPSPAWDEPVAQRVQDVIDSVVNPGVAGHGGVVALDRVVDGVAYISFGGGCQGCGAADVTLKQGIDRILREHVPEIRGVADATDHDAGQNPYYARATSGVESPLS